MATDLVNALSRQGLYELLRLRLVKTIPGAAPAAGANFLTVVPAGVTWELLAFRFVMVTSAVVANRVAVVDVLDSDGNAAQRFTTTRTQTASLSIPYTYAAGIGASVGNVVNVDMLPAPPVVLLAGWTLRTTFAAIDVGDQMSSVVVTVREWSPDQISKQAAWLGRQLPTDILIDEGAE